MKRIVLSTVLALAMGNIAGAQTITGEFSFYASIAITFPAEFSYDGKPRLMLWNDNERSFTVYDENLKKGKTINLKSLSFDYQLDVQTEEREIKSVDEIYKHDYNTWTSLEEFIERESMLNPSFTKDCLIFTPLENGGQRIDFDWTKLDGQFYREDYFGKKYPLVYLEEHNGKITGYRVFYEITYSDWVDKGITSENCSEELRPLGLVNFNLNHNVSVKPDYFYLSQTLFNDDEAYEYLVPKYKLVEGAYSGGTSEEDPSRIELTRSTVVSKEASLALCGFQVVGENGNVLQNLDFDNYLGGSNIYNPYVLTIGSNTYLAFDGEDSEGKSATIFYKIDRTTSSIQKVRTVPGGMNLSRTIANKGSDIQVNFSDNNEKGSEITVFSVNGAKVKSLKVPAGQKTATFNVNAAAGMYLVNRAQNGKANETKKIVIK